MGIRIESLASQITQMQAHKGRICQARKIPLNTKLLNTLRLLHENNYRRRWPPFKRHRAESGGIHLVETLGGKFKKLELWNIRLENLLSFNCSVRIRVIVALITLTVLAHNRDDPVLVGSVAFDYPCLRFYLVSIPVSEYVPKFNSSNPHSHHYLSPFLRTIHFPCCSLGFPTFEKYILAELWHGTFPNRVLCHN